MSVVAAYSAVLFVTAFVMIFTPLAFLGNLGVLDYALAYATDGCGAITPAPDNDTLMGPRV